MDYAASVPLSGDAGKALGLAVAALTGVGFRVTDRSAASVELAGPGMNSSRESPLAGATRVRLTAGGGELALDADLGGVRRMAWFVTLFPPLLLLGLGVILSGVFWAVFGAGPWMWIVAAALGVNTLVWAVLGPLMGRAIRGRTGRGLEALLANAAAAG